MSGHELRQKRLAAGIAGVLLSKRAKIDRARISLIERGYVQPTPSELERINKAIEDLTRARAEVLKLAAEVGWPM